MKRFGQVTSKPVYEEDYYEEQFVTLIRFRANRAEVSAALAERWRFIREMQDAGHLAEHGCRCGHCQRGWDCCGRFFCAGTRVKRAKRGLLVQQSWQRNI